MINQTSTICKLIILHMLDSTDIPLTNAHISDLILTQGYTNYFSLQQAIGELVQSEFIIGESTSNSTYYRISNSGKEILDNFSDKISDGIRQDVIEYFDSNRIAIRDDSSVIANHYQDDSSNHHIRLIMREKEKTVLEINMEVPNKDLAETMCTNWRNKNSTVYGTILDLLS